MGEARENRTSNPRTHEPSNAVACAVVVRSIPPLNTTMGIGGSKGYVRTADPCTGCSLLYTTTTTPQAFGVTGVCPSPKSRMEAPHGVFLHLACVLPPSRLQHAATHCGAGGGVEGERMPGVKKHRVVPRPEGVIGNRDSDDGHTPVSTKTCEVEVVM